MARIHSLSDYQKQYRQSVEDPHAYWGKIAEEFSWHKKWDVVSKGNLKDLDIRWFDGAELNITENCLDRHLQKKAEKTAVIFESNDPDNGPEQITYQELHLRVCKFANVLKKLGMSKGDIACFYMGMTPELLIGILACARIGVIHSVVFGGFSAVALGDRIRDCGAKVLITADGGLRGSKVIPLKDIADSALENCPSIKSVVVHQRAKNPIAMKDNRDFWMHELMESSSKDCPAVVMKAEDPLFILYTSGSTGKPKGLLHTTAGYMIYAGHTFNNVFQMNEDDIYWCTADIGWITGHSYIAYGPLLNAETTVMFEGIPTWPNGDRFWKVIEKLKVTHFYTAPTAIRSLLSLDVNLVKNCDLSSLKVLGSVGEPINLEAWQWYHKHIGSGKCPIVDTWWQTETGGIMISPLANITPCLPTSATLPLPGIRPALMDNEGREVSTPKGEGNLCIASAWPGMARTIYGDHERYKKTYFSSYPGFYFTGDGAKRDEKGNYRITGRVDDVINVSGHRIGTAEIENVLNLHEDITESAVVGHPHPVKGQGIYAYVVCKKEKEGSNKKDELTKLINHHIGPIAKPDKIQLVRGLPKTRSGKIMRRILRKIAAGDIKNFGDTSTLEASGMLQEIIDNRL